MSYELPPEYWLTLRCVMCGEILYSERFDLTKKVENWRDDWSVKLLDSWKEHDDKHELSAK